MDIYAIIKTIGSGSFGQVYLVVNRQNNKQYVMKKIRIRDLELKDRENTETEV